MKGGRLPEPFGSHNKWLHVLRALLGRVWSLWRSRRWRANLLFWPIGKEVEIVGWRSQLQVTRLWRGAQLCRRKKRLGKILCGCTGSQVIHVVRIGCMKIIFCVKCTIHTDNESNTPLISSNSVCRSFNWPPTTSVVFCTLFCVSLISFQGIKKFSSFFVCTLSTQPEMDSESPWRGQYFLPGPCCLFKD